MKRTAKTRLAHLLKRLADYRYYRLRGYGVRAAWHMAGLAL